MVQDARFSRASCTWMTKGAGAKVDIILSIDLGTTGLKVGLVETMGTVIASESSEYPILSPQTGYAEQDPDAWWQSVVDCCNIPGIVCGFNTVIV